MSTFAGPIDPATTVGAVRLRVADLDASRSFYEDVLGLETLESSSSEARLGAGGSPLVELAAAPEAPLRPLRSTGLFHLALLVPDRPRLAIALRRLARRGWRLTGASDHLVSEALYLNDPEGNGIEIYRDRPREQWHWEDGTVEMDTLPLNLEDVLGESADDDDDAMAPETRMGHVHLTVADIPDADAFYSGLLGFKPTVRGYPGALFVAAGGYHHHLGLNTWAGAGAPAPPPGSRGLEHFEVILPSDDALEALGGRLERGGARPERDRDGGLALADPFANRILVRVAG